jgi:hypothetical protein
MKVNLLIFVFIIVFMCASFSGMFDFIKPYRYMVSPKISGIVFKQGEPVKDIEISLLAGFSQYYERNTKTDSAGRFYFDEIYHHHWVKTFSLNTNLNAIRLVANFNQNEVLLWSSHSGLQIHDYVTDNLAALECELDDLDSEFQFKNRVNPNGRPHIVFGVCRLRGFEHKELRNID